MDLIIKVGAITELEAAEHSKQVLYFEFLLNDVYEVLGFN